MSALTPYERMDELLSGVFPETFYRPLLRNWQALRSPGEMKLDVAETEKAYRVKAQIPGAKKDDVHIRIDGNVVSISAEIKDEKEERSRDNERCLTKELYYGSMARSFSLDHEIDEKEAHAAFADGMLTIELPKRAIAKGTSLKVS